MEIEVPEWHSPGSLDLGSYVNLIPKNLQNHIGTKANQETPGTGNSHVYTYIKTKGPHEVTRWRKSRLPQQGAFSTLQNSANTETKKILIGDNTKCIPLPDSSRHTESPSLRSELDLVPRTTILGTPSEESQQPTWQLLPRIGPHDNNSDETKPMWITVKRALEARTTKAEWFDNARAKAEWLYNVRESRMIFHGRRICSEQHPRMVFVCPLGSYHFSHENKKAPEPPVKLRRKVNSIQRHAIFAPYPPPRTKDFTIYNLPVEATINPGITIEILARTSVPTEINKTQTNVLVVLEKEPDQGRHGRPRDPLSRSLVEDNKTQVSSVPTSMGRVALAAAHLKSGHARPEKPCDSQTKLVVVKFSR